MKTLEKSKFLSKAPVLQIHNTESSSKKVISKYKEEIKLGLVIWESPDDNVMTLDASDGLISSI